MPIAPNFGRRRPPLSPTAIDVLARWSDILKSLDIRGCTLFCTLKGDRLSNRYIRNLLHRLAGQAWLDRRVHPHGLRHTYAAS